jgi:nitrate reductase gamma subunit
VSETARIMLYAVLPYAALAAFVVGHIWRYKRDQYRWTARSTQLLESRALRYGSILFHYGAFAAIGGHVLGVLIPASWTEAVGIDDDAYHVISAIGGIAAGSAVIIGLAVLIWRRLRFPRVRVTTQRMDVVVFALLAVTIGTGMAVTVLNNVASTIEYRDDVAPWFRSLLIFSPDVDEMAGVHWVLQLHVTLAWLLYGLWPFSRLVHAWSLPVDWFRRSHILYRGRPGGQRLTRPGAAARSGVR